MKTRITYHNERSWRSDYFQAAARGQEFVIEGGCSVEEWARSIIRNNECDHLVGHYLNRIPQESKAILYG